MGVVVNRDRLEAALCRESFYDFVQRFWDQVIFEKPVWNWHIEYLCAEIQKVLMRAVQRLPKEYDLIVNVPPGSTKSTIASVMAPAWIWTVDQSFRTIAGSYAFPLALTLGFQCRKIIDCDKYKRLFPEVKLERDSQGMLQTTRGGQRVATSTEGSITGFHGHAIIIDDPLNPKEAVSEVALKGANDWFDHTLISRMVDKSVTPVLLIMQRLHENDPTGHRLSKVNVPVRHICIPATLSEKVRPRSLRKKYVDGLFDPVRLPRKVLDQTKMDMGTYSYAGQYDQHPVPLGGGMFRTDQVKIRQQASRVVKMVRYWDKAGCLIPGSLIETDEGRKPIEGVRAGDRVWTRTGWRDVVWAGATYDATELVSVLFSNGAVLTGTPDHPVWTSNRNWVGLGTLRKGDYAAGLWQDSATPISSPSSSSASTTPDLTSQGVPASLGSGTSGRCDGTLSANGTGKTPCTGPSGGPITGTYPLAVISTTRATTGTTIRLKILSASLRRSISRPVGRSGKRPSIEPFCEAFVRRVQGPHYGSTKRRRGGATSASSAGRSSIAGSLIRSASCTAKGSARIGITTAPVTVYDLTVSGAPEYFANGICVHNTGGKGAWTVGVLMCVDGDRRYGILDVVRGQWESNERERIIRQTAERDGKSILIGVEQEPGSGGKESAQSTVKNLTGFRVRLDRPVGDKALRADPYATQVNAGNVWMLAGIWNGNYLAEMGYFPFSTYKDQMDASSGAFAMLTKIKRAVGAF